MFLIFTNLQLTNDAGAASNQKLLLAAYDEKGKELSGAAGINALVIDNTKFSQLAYNGYELKIAKVAEYPNPLVLLGDHIPAETNAVNIDAVYNAVKKQLNGSARLTESVKQKFVTLLTNNSVPAAVAELVITCCYACIDWLGKDFHLITTFGSAQVHSDFAKQTQAWINEISRKNTMAAIPDNETKFQPSCSSELFIKLPAYEAMFNYLSNEEDETEHQELRDLHVFMPSRDEVSTPYGSKAEAFEDPDSVQRMIESGGAAYEAVLKTVIGQASNNTDEIFDNEKRYYDALNKWMSIIAENADGEDHGDLCQISLEYLHTLAETLYIWYWQHNKRVPCAIEIGSGETADESKYTFRNEDHIGVAPNDLVNFLDRVAADLGRVAYAKAIIQLARWGSRKPDAIVFDGYEKCFDLNTGIVKHSMPSLASYDRVKVNGCDMKFIGFINDTTNIADSRIGFRQWPMPTGVVLSQVFANKGTSDTIELNTYYSMIDIVKEIVLGHVTVDGVQFNESNWIVVPNQNDVSIDEVIEASKQPDTLQFPIFRGMGLIQIYADLHINSPSNSDTQFSIMCSKLQSSKLLDFIDTSEFHTYAEFDTLTRTGKPGRKQATDYMIVRDLLKVYHEAATNYSPDCDASGIFKLWYDAIMTTGYVDEAYFYEGSTKHADPLPGCHTENFAKLWWRKDNAASAPQTATPQPMFNGATRPAQAAQAAAATTSAGSATVDYKTTILSAPAANCTYCRFVDKNNETIFVAAVNPRFKKLQDGTKRPDSIFVILDRQTASSLNVDQISKVEPISCLITHMCKVFYTMAMNVPVKSNLRFLSSEAIKETHQYFKSLE